MKLFVKVVKILIIDQNKGNHYVDKYGYINKNGDWAITAKYDFGTEFSEGLAFVREDFVNSTFVIDTSGKRVFNLLEEMKKQNVKLKNYKPYENGLAFVQNEKGCWAGIDKKGKLVTNFYSVSSLAEPNEIVKITNLSFATRLLEKEGAKVLHYISEQLFLNERGTAQIKNALKTYLKRNQSKFENEETFKECILKTKFAFECAVRNAEKKGQNSEKLDISSDNLVEEYFK